MLEVEKAAEAGLVACFQGWGVTLGRAGRRAEVAMEREKVRGTAREMVRRDNILMMNYLE